jgi:HEAT repeat protein
MSEIDQHIRDLKNQDTQKRVKAAEALQNTVDERAVKPLIDALKDSFWQVRNEAALALGKAGDLRAAQPLVHTMEDTSGYVRWAAAWALGELKVYAAVPRLIAALNDDFENFGRFPVRLAAAEALAEIGDEQAIEPLKRALESENDEVRETAARALKMIEEQHRESTA